MRRPVRRALRARADRGPRTGESSNRSCVTSELQFTQQLARGGMRRDAAHAQLFEQGGHATGAMPRELVAQDRFAGRKQATLGNGGSPRVDLARLLEHAAMPVDFAEESLDAVVAQGTRGHDRWPPRGMPPAGRFGPRSGTFR